MTRADHFREMIDTLMEIMPEHNPMLLRFRAEINKMEKEIQDAAQKTQDEHIKYWMDVASGEKKRYVTFDNGATVYQLTATKMEHAPSEQIAFMDIGRPIKHW